ncbi:hypothetical protein PC114_g11050 [Phytophthora cactorum]|nr:hypothetical protein PC114_g11050 [Phytophthora cactorum]
MIEDGNLDQPRDIILYAKDHRLFRLFETHATYDPLQYPLLLPYGELGWTYTDTYDGDVVRRNKRGMSLRKHVAYRLYQKCDGQSVLHQGGACFSSIAWISELSASRNNYDGWRRISRRSARTCIAG